MVLGTVDKKEKKLFEKKIKKKQCFKGGGER